MKHAFKLTALALLCVLSEAPQAQTMTPSLSNFELRHHRGGPNAEKPIRPEPPAAHGPKGHSSTFQPWMNSEVLDAWNAGYKGQGTRIIVTDAFSNSGKFEGNMTGKVERKTHGDWTSTQAALLAPQAQIVKFDMMTKENSAISLGTGKGLNVINASWGVMLKPADFNAYVPFAIDSSLASHAEKATAVVSFAVANTPNAVDAVDSEGYMDYTAMSLKGKPGAIFVGSLQKHGTVNNPATMNSYSAYAGADPAIQKQFLVVANGGAQTMLEGNSFAAPVISGYSAILGSKFTQATPVQIVNQLLSTARKDTIANYNVAVHGQGEASIARALAPVSIR